MKKIVFLLLFLFGFNLAIAECSMSGIRFFPKQKEISLNSMFIIQGYSFSQKTINSFKNRIIYLESENGELVELNLLKILKGQMNLTQAIFNPSKELKSNTTYFLKYTGQTQNESKEMMQYNKEKKKREKVFWRTTNKKALKALNSNLNIEFEKTEVRYYGCGPSSNAIFKINNKGNSEIWYKTEVIEIGTNSKRIYYIKEWKEKLYIGHGMCSGAFKFSKKGKYKVRFTPMNTDGKSLKTTNWVIFDSPYINAKNPFGF